MDTFSDAVHIIRVNVVSSIPAYLGQRSHGGGHHGTSAGHDLERGHAEAFVKRWKKNGLNCKGKANPVSEHSR